MSEELSLCDEYCITCVHGICTQHGSCSDCAGTNNVIKNPTVRGTGYCDPDLEEEPVPVWIRTNKKSQNFFV